jgi:hypothetical protein
VVATEPRIDHRQLEVSEKGGSKKSSTTGIGTGQGPELVFTPDKWVRPATLLSFVCKVIPVKQHPKHYEGLLIQPPNICG